MEAISGLSDPLQISILISIACAIISFVLSGVTALRTRGVIQEDTAGWYNQVNGRSSATGLPVSREQDRPGCVTAFVLFCGLGSVVGLFLAFGTDVIASYHPSAPLATAVSSLLAVVICIGFWRMRRWAFIVYGLYIVLACIAYPVAIGNSGDQIVPGLAGHVFIFAVLMRYHSRMS